MLPHFRRFDASLMQHLASSRLLHRGYIMTLLENEIQDFCIDSRGEKQDKDWHRRRMFQQDSEWYSPEDTRRSYAQDNIISITQR